MTSTVKVLAKGLIGLIRTGKDGMRLIPPAQRFVVAKTQGIYYHSAGIVNTPRGLISIYRTCDDHLASWSNINMARSVDGGKTWIDHKILSTSSFAKDKACWIAPQTNILPDGRIVVIVDRGVKKTPFDWPTLSEWQKTDRGMSNYLLISNDYGNSWEPARKIDNVGGEPSYVVPLSNGSLMYTRTDSAPTDAKKNPEAPWLNNYYKSTAVFSDDNGKSWNRTSPIFNDPLIGDCEVGVVEYQKGKLMAISRIGDAGSKYGQPSRMSLSEDYGKTWSKPILLPIYAHRPCVKKLNNGRILVSFRHANESTSGTFAWEFSMEKRFDYTPGYFIPNERAVVLQDGLQIITEEGIEKAAQFILYPMEDDDSTCEIEATFAVKQADTYGCCIAAGAWISFQPGKVTIADHPEHSFDFDTINFHNYKIINKDHRLKIYADEVLKLDISTEGIFTRYVRFGNRRGAMPGPGYKSTVLRDPDKVDSGGFYRNQSRSIWKSVKVKVSNRRDYSINWQWDAKSGHYPDQFRRDNLVMLELNASYGVGNSGYSSWAELADGSVIIADYTCTDKELPKPILKTYLLTKDDLKTM